MEKLSTERQFEIKEEAREKTAFAEGWVYGEASKRYVACGHASSAPRNVDVRRDRRRRGCWRPCRKDCLKLIWR